MEFVFNNMGKIIGVMAVLVVLALVGGMLTTVTGTDQNAAKDNADKWAKELGVEVAGISCAKNDKDIEAKREAAPRVAAEKKAEVKKTKLEQARDDYEAGNLTDEEYANILDELDPLPPPTAAAPAPASARAPLLKKPEEPKPWFTEGNAPDTVFDGTGEGQQHSAD